MRINFIVMDNGSISKNIAKVRSSLGMTQKEMAEAIGTSRTNFCKIESGGISLVSGHIYRIAELAGATPEEILLGYEPYGDSGTALKDTRDRYAVQIKALKADYEARLAKDRAEISLMKELLDEKDRSIRNLQSIVDYLSKSK